MDACMITESDIIGFRKLACAVVEDAMTDAQSSKRLTRDKAHSFLLGNAGDIKFWLDLTPNVDTRAAMAKLKETIKGTNNNSGPKMGYTKGGIAGRNASRILHGGTYVSVKDACTILGGAAYATIYQRHRDHPRASLSQLATMGSKKFKICSQPQQNAPQN